MPDVVRSLPDPLAALKRRTPEDRLRLLVSVRDAEEAATAIAAGVDVLDVKEPRRGALGRADDGTLNEIAAVASGALPLSFAGGEAVDFLAIDSGGVEGDERQGALNAGRYSFFKYGPAGLARRSDFAETLLTAWRSRPRGAFPIAVAYVDYRDADAPRPEAIVELAVASRCAGMLFDTFGKVAGLGLTALPEERLAACIEEAKRAGLLVALAGSLGACDVPQVRRLGADVIAVRGSVCRRNRDGRVEGDRIAALFEAIERDRAASVDLARSRDRA